MKGFVLVLVVDGEQATVGDDTLARVCRDYDVSNVGELSSEILTAGRQAANQIAAAQQRLRERQAAGQA
jgi:hypothetical protein